MHIVLLHHHHLCSSIQPFLLLMFSSICEVFLFRQRSKLVDLFFLLMAERCLIVIFSLLSCVFFFFFFFFFFFSMSMTHNTHNHNNTQKHLLLVLFVSRERETMMEPFDLRDDLCFLLFCFSEKKNFTE